MQSFAGKTFERKSKGILTRVKKPKGFDGFDRLMKGLMMSKLAEVSLVEVVGSYFCVASEDGHVVYTRVTSTLARGQCTTVSFANVTHLSAAFLNASFGRLACEFSAKELGRKLRLTKIRPADRAYVSAVMRNALGYRKSPDRFAEAWRDVIGKNDPSVASSLLRS